VSLKELRDAFSVLVADYRNQHGSTIDVGDDIFDAIYLAVVKQGAGAHWELREGFTRRVK
jgi:hypothetical protein